MTRALRFFTRTRHPEETALRSCRPALYLQTKVADEPWAGGADIRAVFELRGHESIETTPISTHVMQEPGLGVRRLWDG